MNYAFVHNDRLGIPLPAMQVDWEQLSEAEQAELLLHWEEIRGRIPNRIFELERVIIGKQRRLDMEDDFPMSCRLNSEIAEVASKINDLHLWFRVNQEMEAKPHR